MSNSYQLTARQAVKLLRRGKISPDELITDALARIAEIDGRLNAPADNLRGARLGKGR